VVVDCSLERQLKKLRSNLIWLAGSIGLGLGAFNCPTHGQIVPDDTLGSEASVVTTVDPFTDRVDGGAVRGDNLFHSFQDFNIGDGRTVNFSHPAAVDNILTRVTGGNVSEILGTLGVLGDANLFLLNPNGIVFGPNARLNLNGSFVATTADRFSFPNGYEFSATNPDTPPLLTVNVPLGLQFGGNPGAISVSGSGFGFISESGFPDTSPENQQAFVSNSNGLQVMEGRTLGLVGGDLDVNGGLFEASAGRIELGSVAAGETVALTPTDLGWILGYDTVEQFGNIRIAGQSALFASGEGGGEIQIWGSEIDIAGESSVLADTLGSEDGSGINIYADRLNLREGSFAYAETWSPSGGSAGDVSVVANTLDVRDGSTLSSSTWGEGDGGAVRLDVTDTLVFASNSPEGASSAIFANVEDSGIGNAGDVSITANRVEIRDGAQLTATIWGEGDGGTIEVDATDTVLFSGSTPDNQFGSGAFTSVAYSERRNVAGRGNAGSVIITANRVEVRDSAQLFSNHKNPANPDSTAGDVIVRAEFVQLSDDAEISADTQGRGGNVQIDAGTTILRHGSRIQTNAEGPFPAGNITIDTDTLTALENSDITANARDAAGGQVTINTQGIFGTQFRNRLTPESDITATSALGSSFGGTVELNTPDIDTAAGLVSLSANPVDAASVLSTDPCATGRNSAFYITGRGGLPQIPDAVFPTTATWVDLQDVAEVDEEETSDDRTSFASAVRSIIDRPETTPLVEARDWYVNAEGQVVLTASRGGRNPHPSRWQPESCSPSSF